ncbi:MAG: Serine/threonine protein kinaserelated protein, partial [Verrucomicrobiales bacterium]|nr:Serine/threonine protein kinaserelated protein [Verrucomicrobiales bacterium]
MSHSISRTKRSHSRTGTVASVLLRTQSFLRTQFWVWPLVAALLLGFIGTWLRVKMESATKQQIAGTLQTILSANADALRTWSITVKSDAENLAEDQRVRELVNGLLQQSLTGGQVQAALLTAPELPELRAHLKPVLDRRGFNGFVVLDTHFLVIASMSDQLVGMLKPPGYLEQMQPCLTGTSVVTRPFPSISLLPDEQGQLRAAVPTMFAVTPIRSLEGVIIAILALRIEPDKDFTRILGTARGGNSGETFAFNRDGKLISESRFDNDLRQAGLIPDAVTSRSTLTLELRDPMVNLTGGRQSPKRRNELPFILSVREALAGRSGTDANGYRDYRGVQVVGAWTWLKDFELGLVTEMEVSEALRPLRILRAGFWSIFGVLLIGAVLVFLLMRLANRLQAAARKAALNAKQLGQYALGDKIGEGAFGAVYRAHHALMRRPVAVKLLQTDKLNLASAVRFEREVQMTSQLCHPNTIALYDFGRTPEGI